MKKQLLYITVLLVFITGYAQNTANDLNKIAESEMKSAFKLKNFKSNPNTANYNVTHQKLEFAVNPAVYFITGSVTTTYTALSSMSTITFDLYSGLSVNSVTKNGVPLTFVQNSNNELIITLPATQAAGTTGIVKVNYSGQPGTAEEAFTTGTHNSIPELWTLSQPYGARDWWPCKQDLNDKIESLDVFITAPAAYKSVANGLEVGVVTNGNNTKTTHFQHNYPIPAYLVAIAVTNYTVFTQQAGTAPNTFPIVNYLYPESQQESEQHLAVTLPVMNLYEQLFETYPFHEEKYGHAQCGIGGGMEHTTVSFMGNFGRELIAHELAHQWFGNKITCATWKDIWLNEGFATYLSGLVVENQDGNDAFTAWKAGKIQSITSQPGGNIYLTDTQAENSGRIFNIRLTYNKGGMAVHMLRYKMGDEAFYQGLKNYLADPALAYGYATTPQLQAHLEAAYGSSLTDFFNDWIYNQGYPTYNVNVSNTTTQEAKIIVSQTQSHSSVSYFEMPITVRLLGENNQVHDVVLDNTFNNQEFTVPVPFYVTGVVFNPFNDVISGNNTTNLTTDNFLLTGVKLYPSPAGSTLNIQMPNGVQLQKAVVYNVLGNRVMESAVQSTLNVTGLAGGMYFITLQTDKGSSQLKFIKE